MLFRSNLISDYAFFIGNLCCNSKEILNIMKEYGSNYGIGKERLGELLIEINTPQLLSSTKPRNIKDALEYHNNTIKKYQNNTLFIIGKSIYYVSDIKTLRNILILNKTINRNLKLRIYHNIFFISKVPIGIETRVKIWGQILSPEPYIDFFDELKIDFMANADQRNESELIKLDVNRSFKFSTAFDPEALVKILEYWSSCQNNISYYQGMNFIAALLLLMTHDIPQTFAYFHQFINVSKVYKLFTPNMNLLISRCYQLNRLLFIHYPELASWLQSESVMSSCFATSWLITIFSNSLHGIKKNSIPYLLFPIWDSFLTDGWKALFKSILFLIGKIQKRLVGKRMNAIVEIFSEFQQEIFKNSEEIGKEFIEVYGKIKVTNSILEKLQIEYETLTKLS